MSRTIKIGGASGYWGESDMAMPQFLRSADLDYIVFDYLAEITMSIMAHQRQKDPTAGYARDFVTSAMAPHLAELSERNIKVISNAGGVNPESCAAALRGEIKKAGLDLRVAVIVGDDLLPRKAEFTATEMFSGDAYPELEKIVSLNAYIGAFPIAHALSQGADIVITGRCVDSAVTLGACIYEFGWRAEAWDQLAGGSLAGHILECGPQATGGNYTDWEDIADTLADIGYPIAEISNDGSFSVTKPEGTGGTVTRGTVGEQMLYEIGDPQDYKLPDVICDFSHVELIQTAPDCVSVTGAKGYPAPETYKASLTYSDGWKVATQVLFVGEKAETKARLFYDHALTRTRRKLRAMNAPDFDDIMLEPVGAEAHYGDFGQDTDAREIMMKFAAKHANPKALGLLLKEAAGMGLATPPGLCMYAGARPKPTPITRLFSLKVPKSDIPIKIILDDTISDFTAQNTVTSDTVASDTGPTAVNLPISLASTDGFTSVTLIKLAYARSGDKGDKANIGVFPRNADYVPYIWDALTETVIASRFKHFLRGRVERFYMPGMGAINFLLHDVLGGGGMASLRNDPQGKTYAQILLQTPIAVPASLAETF